MIDAEQANKLTRSKATISECLTIVERAIRVAIEQGDYECCADLSGRDYASIIDVVAHLLIDKYGFDVVLPVQKMMKQELINDKLETYSDFRLNISWKGKHHG